MGGHGTNHCFLDCDHFLLVLRVVVYEVDQPCLPQLKQKAVGGLRLWVNSKIQGYISFCKEVVWNTC